MTVNGFKVNMSVRFNEGGKTYIGVVAALTQNKNKVFIVVEEPTERIKDGFPESGMKKVHHLIPIQYVNKA